MTRAEWDDWLVRWWRPQWEMRHAEPPDCHVCGATSGLVLLRRTDPDGPLYYDDMLPVCRRCHTRIAQLAANRRSPGARWHGMPRYLAVDSIIDELTHGRTSLDAGEDE